MHSSEFHIPLPDYASLTPALASARLDAVLADCEQGLQAVLASNHSTVDWDSLILPLTAMEEALNRAWSPISHLFAVMSTPAWREAYNAGRPKVTQWSLTLAQSEPLYRAYKQLADSPAFQTLSATRKKLVSDALRDFRLSGIALPSAQKQRYQEITLRLSELTSKFEENVMDCAQAWSLLIEDEARLAGMPAAAIAAARQRAEAKQQDGWLLTLDYPSFDAVITHARDRELRQRLYTAWSTRASDEYVLGGHDARHDNSALMREILQLRAEEAALLGYASYAEVSLASKMAESPAQVEAFLLDLAQRARPHAQAELEALQAFARKQGGPEVLQPWDLAFYSEQLREEKLGLSDELLRPYFPLPRVLDGLFTLVQQLYGIRIEPVDGVATWHSDVQVFGIGDAAGKPIGLFYLDPYARSESKRGGAWMDECASRWQRATGLQHPAAYLVCNFRPAGAGEPALLTHDEVTTLFHEFGHGLHHLLTRVEEAGLAGIRGVEWDAVELPSQFMENWCYDAATLKTFARHWRTDEALPDALIGKLREDRRFQAAMGTLRQVEFALFDLRVHGASAAIHDNAAMLALLKQVREQVAVLNPPEFNRMPWSFSHIFAGGYAAGYYSYKWAEVLSADVYAAFTEQGDLVATGRRFLERLLSRGGSAPALELFRDFRGREPRLDALLAQDGLAELEAA